LAEIDASTGKVFYDKEVAEYDAKLKELENTIKFTADALKDAKFELGNTEEELKKLKATSPEELFNNLVKQLQDLGVEGLEGVTTFEKLEKAVIQLNSKALEKVNNNLEEAKVHLGNMGKEAKAAKKGIDESTEAIKAQNEAIAEQQAFENKIK
jgi:hypothetical protein